MSSRTVLTRSRVIPGGWVDDGDLGAREHVEDGGLTDVGPADDGDARERHGADGIGLARTGRGK